MSFEERVKSRYAGAAGRRYHDSVHAVPEPAFDWVAELRSRKMSAWVGPQDTVLEFGVGPGWNLARLSCRRRLGYDLSRHLKAHLANRGIDFVEQMMDLPDEAVDVAICHHVLEHTAHPPETLQAIRRVLRSGAHLLLFVPYERGRKYRRFDPGEPNHHLYSWNVQTLGNLVTASGFAVTRACRRRFGYDRFAGLWAVRLHVGRFGFHWIRGLLHLIQPGFEVFVAARKP